jgi:putative membrane protein
MPTLTGPPLAAAVLAHGVGNVDAERWSSLLAYVALAALAAGYGRGVHELWHRRGVGTVVPAWRVGAFAAGLAVLAAALSPAVHAAAEDSFAAHMGQHMVFLVVAGPLLAAGAAGVPLAVAVPATLRAPLARVRGSGPVRWLRRPVKRAIVAGIVQTAVVWGWHLPRPYLLAVGSEPVHVAEHCCLLGAAWLLWTCVVGPERHRLPAPAGLLLVFTAGMPATALGVVLGLATVPLYPPAALAPHGGDPVAAQQLGGLVMWAPMEAVVLALAAVAFLRWLAGLERRRPAGRALGPPIEEVTTL